MHRANAPLGDLDFRIMLAFLAESEFDRLTIVRGTLQLQSVARSILGKSEIAIGELSRRTECNIKTIRYHERIALLPQPRRTDSRFRRYDDERCCAASFHTPRPPTRLYADEVRAFLPRRNRGGGRAR